MKNVTLLALLVGGILSADLLAASLGGKGLVADIVSNRIELSSAPGVAVNDDIAAALRGTATLEAECGGWDSDSGGCDTSYSVDYCPEDFDVFDEDGCFWCEYSNHKHAAARDCTAGNVEYTNYCTSVFDQLDGCVVSD